MNVFQNPEIIFDKTYPVLLLHYTNFWKSHFLCTNSFIHFSFQGSVKFIETNMWSMAHFVLTLLHLVQMTLAYFLMLIVMTYNSWLCGAVILGNPLCAIYAPIKKNLVKYLTLCLLFIYFFLSFRLNCWLFSGWLA